MTEGGGSNPRARFAHVDTWVFDLDNTLYPHDSDLWPRIDQRITLFLAQLFGLDGASSRALQKYYYERYGTTLAGLIAEDKISPEEFLSFVHDIDRSSLQPDTALAGAIAALPGRKLILTNGSRDHAAKTAEKLGILSIFDDIFDIVAADLVPKPLAVTYEKFFALHGVDPGRAAMFEDLPKNLVVPHARGMVTVLIVPAAGVASQGEASANAVVAQAAHVDFLTSDLTAFLHAVAPAPPAS